MALEVFMVIDKISIEQINIVLLDLLKKIEALQKRIEVLEKK